MDWNYLETEIIEKIIWEVENGKEFTDTINKICHEYSLEFPKFSNSINDLKRKITYLPQASKKNKKYN